MVRLPVLATGLDHLIPPESLPDPIAIHSDQGLSLCLRGRLLPQLHPPPDRFQTHASMHPHHSNTPLFSPQAFPSASQF